MMSLFHYTGKDNRKEDPDNRFDPREYETSESAFSFIEQQTWFRGSPRLQAEKSGKNTSLLVFTFLSF